MKYKSTREVTVRELDDYLARGWDIIVTRTIRSVQPNGSFEDKIIYVVGEPL
jgi:hypothetical protein